MALAIGILAFVLMLMVAAIVVLAAIAAVVEILPPLRNRDADDRGGRMPVTARLHPRPQPSLWHERKPHTRLGR